MEIITLNQNNCKEYTEEQFESKLNEMQRKEESSDFWEMIQDDSADFDAMFDSSEVDAKIEAQEKAAAAERALLDAKINQVFDARIKVAQADLLKWKAKNYKKSKGSVFVGGELEGDSYSFNYINNKRRDNRINNLKEEIKELEEFKEFFLKKDSEFYSQAVPHFYTGFAREAFILITK